jgi:hypothetical protein
MSLLLNGTDGVTYNDGTLQSSAPVGRNLIINGNMQIAQRGTTGTPTAGGDYLASDRWKAWNASDAVVTVSQETDGPTGQFTKCLKYNVTTADASIAAAQFGMVRQMIEGYNIIDLGFGTASAQSVTISFWVKSSLTGSHGAALNNGNDDRSYPFAYTISVANTWEYKTVTIPGDTSGTWDTDNTAGMTITFGMGTGSQYAGTADAWQAGNKFQPTSTVANIGTISNWNVTGVQLEANTTATPFENLMYSQQLSLCQRYFQSFGGSNVNETVGQGTSFSTTNTYVLIHLLQTMRSVPSLGYSAVGDWRLHYPGVTGQEATVMAISTSDSNNTKVIVNTTTATNASMGGGKCIQLTADNTLSARLTFSAEL